MARGTRNAAVMLVFGAATWTQLALFPALARPSTAALASTLVPLLALAAMSRGALSAEASAPQPLRRQTLAASAGAFPLGLALAALGAGRHGVTRFDLSAQLMAALTTAAFAASVAAWWSATAPRHATVSLGALESATAPTSSPPLAGAARLLMLAHGLVLAVVAPAWLGTTARAAFGPGGDTLLRGRLALVSAGGLGLAVALTLSAGSGLLRRAPPRPRSPARALWLLAGGFAAAAMRLWLDRAR